MATLIAIPILAGMLIFQTAVLNQIPLLQGSADLVLLSLAAWSLQKRVKTAWAWGLIGGLMVGFVSAAPQGVYLIGYMLTVTVGWLLRQQISSVPILAMLIAAFSGTLILNGITLLALRLMDTPLTIGASINLIVLPSLLLNLILALPFYVIFKDLATLLYPETMEI